MRTIIAFIIGIVLFGACSEHSEKPKITIQNTDILIANQGNFGWGEGTLSLYNPSTKSVQNEVFKAVNGKSLGNVFQSISTHKNSYYFVMNNSGKIIITDSMYKQTGEISGLTSPRYMYPLNENKAYVTDLYANGINVIDLAKNEITHTISCRGWSEKGVFIDGLFWYTGSSTNQLYAIDISNDKLVDSIQVGSSPESLIVDNQSCLWVLCRGDEELKELPCLVRIDKPITGELDLKIELKENPTQLRYDTRLDQLYFINGDIWSMSSKSAIPKPFIAHQNRTFFGINIDPISSDVYVSDVRDFVSRSEVFVYDYQGLLQDTFFVGIIAGDFFFP